ncbi:hypothetical protein P7K49_014771 [Saguinus oedipus]|uniref:Uncharacterized protein n=1 Tax=Saguinus oedipus TaxID=9490 RepID=A0ABQ9V7B3_SAGOE|nr:hypothetical protein P7K49_014771 [Saguinus oedipus]
MSQPSAPLGRRSPGSLRISRLPGLSESLSAAEAASALGLGAAEEEGGRTLAPHSPGPMGAGDVSLG